MPDGSAFIGVKATLIKERKRRNEESYIWLLCFWLKVTYIMLVPVSLAEASHVITFVFHRVRLYNPPTRYMTKPNVREAGK